MLNKIGLTAAVIVGAMAACGIAQMSVFRSVSGKNIFRRNKKQRPLIISHGSARELGPDNALVSFEKYMTMDVDFIEMDLCLTKDGILITHHDEDIRDNDGTLRKICDMDFEEVAEINIAKDYVDVFGGRPYENKLVRIAKLEELLKRYRDNPRNIKFMVELKNTGRIGADAARKLYFLLEKYKMHEKVIVCSFDEPTMKIFRTVSGGRFYTSTTVETARKFVIHSLTRTEALYKCPDKVMALPLENSGYRLDTKQLIDSAHRHNIAVTYWTINDKKVMRDLIIKGADGIITDRPDLMRELLIEMGY